MQWDSSIWLSNHKKMKWFVSRIAKRKKVSDRVKKSHADDTKQATDQRIARLPFTTETVVFDSNPLKKSMKSPICCHFYRIFHVDFDALADKNGTNWRLKEENLAILCNFKWCSAVICFGPFIKSTHQKKVISASNYANYSDLFVDFQQN